MIILYLCFRNKDRTECVQRLNAFVVVEEVVEARGANKLPRHECVGEAFVFVCEMK